MPAHDTSSINRRLASHLRQTFMAGVLLLVPLVITYLILRFLFNSVDGVLAPAVNQLFGRSIPGAGILGLVAIIYMAGVVARNVLGRKIVDMGQKLLLKIPIVRAVYWPSKQLIETFAGHGPNNGFKRVVMIEYPRKGSWAIGFLTSITTNEEGKRLGIVYIPTAPTPNSGWIAVLPVEDIYNTDMTVSEAMGLVLSGGIIAPAEIAKFKSTPHEAIG